MKMKLLIILMMCACVAALLLGCRHNVENVNNQEEPICGGKVDRTDYNAPKEIKSDELTYFNTMFFRRADFVYDEDRSYRFIMTLSEDGKYIICEGDDTLRCETDADFAARLQQLIRDQGLIECNGIDKYTSGIAPEYGPYELCAEYASGEKLRFVMNDDPSAEWTWEILNLFAKEFGKHGVKDLLPPPEDSQMTRFSMEYSFDDVRYIVDELLIPLSEADKGRSLEDIATNGFVEDDCARMVWSVEHDKTGKTELNKDIQVPVSEEYFEELQKIVEEVNLVKFDSGYTSPGGFDGDATPMYYSFYIEYASGKRMCGFSDDPAECEAFKDIAERFGAYCQEYIEKNSAQ